MSDIHGCLAEFEDALSLVLDDIEQGKAKLVLLGDYIHGGPDNRGVLDRIMKLRERFGSDRIIALLGNHDEWVVNGSSTISNNSVYARIEEWEDESDDDEYINWLSSLPLYYVEGNTIFVHAGIDEEAGDMWEWETSEDVFTSKYPAETGKIEGLDMKVVAGHGRHRRNIRRQVLPRHLFRRRISLLHRRHCSRQRSYSGTYGRYGKR